MKILNHTAYIPTEHVIFIDIVLPKASESVLRQAIPTLAEEFLANSLEDNFYALPEHYQPGEKTTIAVIQRERLDEYFQGCKSHENITAIVPDCFLLPANPDAYTRFTENERVIIRTDEYHGFATTENLLMQMLPNADTAIVDCQPEPQTLIFNFMQGPYMPKRPKQKMGLWGKLGIVAAIIIAIHFGYLLYANLVMGHFKEELDDTTLRLYEQVFPGATSVTSPRALIRRELENLGSTSDSVFLNMLGNVSQALALNPEVTLQSIQYQHQQMIVNVKAKSFSALAPFQETLASQSLKVEQTQANQGDGEIQASYSIK